MFQNFLQWLYDWPISGVVRESSWLFPTLEWIHLYSMIFLITVIASLDLRLMGFSLGSGQARGSLAGMLKRVLIWASFAFSVNAVTGLLLFASKSHDEYMNIAFRIKILLIAFGLLYHLTVLPAIAKRNEGAAAVAAPLSNKLTGALSLLIWLGVIAASRWIAFV